MDLPRYFLVGDRPVRFVSTPEGGMDVQAYDWATGDFVREMGYLSRCLGTDVEVDEVDQAAFDAALVRLAARGRT